jgi:hypothetical protein
MWGPCVTEGRGTTKEPEGGNRSRVQPTPRGEAHFPKGFSTYGPVFFVPSFR